MKKQYFSIFLSILLAGCTADDSQPLPSSVRSGDEVELCIAVADTDWQGQTFKVTRSGETLDALKATTGELLSGFDYGFSLHGSDLLGPNSVRRQVTWNAATGQWNSGERIYWKHTTDKTTINVYAYAPYKSDTYPVADGVLTFTSQDYANGNRNPDLLYAGAIVERSNGLAFLTFRHALAKMTLGTITNNSGGTLHLTQVSVSGYIYAQGNLNLSSGDWSDFKYFSGNKDDPYTEITTRKELTMPVSAILGVSSLDIANGESCTLELGSLMLIPGPEVTASLTFTEGSFGFTTTLERGKSKTFNMVVDKNFEVVIE